MLLTDKAKNDFEMWLLTKGNESIKNGTIEYDLYYMCKYMIPQNMVNCKIIEWFDSVGIHIKIIPNISGGSDVYYATVVYREYINVYEINVLNYECNYFNERNEEIKESIKYANRHYNFNNNQD